VQLRRDAFVTTDELLATLRARLAHYKVPKTLELLVELPRIGSGKIDRSELKSRATEVKV
jgi:acyl-CoA synthetase (AMP-forming)/AMP-acid ligase II